MFHGIDRSVETESWNYMTIGGSTYLVPVTSHLARAHRQWVGLAVQVEYRNYRHFEASSNSVSDPGNQGGSVALDQQRLDSGDSKSPEMIVLEESSPSDHASTRRRSLTPVIAAAFVRVTDDPLGIQRHASMEAADWRASYSARNAGARSTCVARRDPGICAAASAASDGGAITLEMVGRSAGCTPKSRAE